MLTVVTQITFFQFELFLTGLTYPHLHAHAVCGSIILLQHPAITLPLNLTCWLSSSLPSIEVCGGETWSIFSSFTPEKSHVTFSSESPKQHFYILPLHRVKVKKYAGQPFTKVRDRKPSSALTQSCDTVPLNLSLHMSNHIFLT